MHRFLLLMCFKYIDITFYSCNPLAGKPSRVFGAQERSTFNNRKINIFTTANYLTIYELSEYVFTDF